MSGFETWRADVRILPDEKGHEIRARYHEAFLDTTSENYAWRVRDLVQFPDGWAQEGYMWDCLRSRRRSTWDEICTVIARADEVLILWDIHSATRIRIPDYWKFGKDSVLACSPAHLESGLQWLPEDLYIFDETLEWSAILTHEPWLDGVEQNMYLAPATVGNV
jgi:hypothetical protein